MSNAPKEQATGFPNNERMFIIFCIRRRANKSLRLLIPAHFKDSISSRPGQPRSGGSCDLCCESQPAIVQLPHIASCLHGSAGTPEGSEQRLKTSTASARGRVHAALFLLPVFYFLGGVSLVCVAYVAIKCDPIRPENMCNCE